MSLRRATGLPALLAALLTLLTLAACSPTFNWREVRVESTRLALLLPCKPDKAQKTVPLGGRETRLSMVGCETGGATFAVAVADIGSSAKAGEVLDQWQRLSLANMKAGLPTARPLKLAGALGPVSVVSAEGRSADGTPVRVSAAYFAQGSQVFQALLMHGEAALPADAADTFFSSLTFE
ncbi:MAG: hypothetical protein LH479_11250 [Polaromonas sp.]|nr:hypothetical protein [Polaromonas sp.]